LGGVYSNASFRLNGLKVAIPPFRPNGFHNSTELMAQNQRCPQSGITDPRILIGMQVAAADSHGFHP
jgi:hypothetical protein